MAHNSPQTVKKRRKFTSGSRFVDSDGINQTSIGERTGQQHLLPLLTCNRRRKRKHELEL
jgi:hypothetical protein